MAEGREGLAHHRWDVYARGHDSAAVNAANFRYGITTTSCIRRRNSIVSCSTSPKKVLPWLAQALRTGFFSSPVKRAGIGGSANASPITKLLAPGKPVNPYCGAANKPHFALPDKPLTWLVAREK